METAASKWAEYLPMIALAVILVGLLIWMRKRRANQAIVWGLLLIFAIPVLDAVLVATGWAFYLASVKDLLLFLRYAVVWWTVSFILYRFLVFALPFDLDTELYQGKNVAIGILVTSIFVMVALLMTKYMLPGKAFVF